ncbi:MAG: hypothetical protein H7061_13050 [Bdellovibrionaceae bacterium]|nr:hypothetical protein [Bdellovibrio sp.]
MKSAISTIETRIAAAQKLGSTQAEFSAFKLQELKFKLIEDFYSKISE